MTPGTVLSIVGSIVVGLLALAGAVYTTRSGGRASPYDSIVKRVTDLENDHDEDRATIEAQVTKIAGLERKVAAVIADRDDVVAYLMVWREWLDHGAVPPAPRIPTHLRDVIPDWDPSDGDRTQDAHLARARAHNDPSEAVGP